MQTIHDPPRPRLLTARQAVGATTLCLLLMALLSSRQMVESAERCPCGTKRDVALGIAHGVDRVTRSCRSTGPAASWSTSPGTTTTTPAVPRPP